MKRVLWQSDGTAVWAHLREAQDGDEIVVISERCAEIVRTALVRSRPALKVTITVDTAACEEEERRHPRIVDYMDLIGTGRMTGAERGEMDRITAAFKEAARDRPLQLLTATAPALREEAAYSDRAPLEADLVLAVVPQTPGEMRIEMLKARETDGDLHLFFDTSALTTGRTSSAAPNHSAPPRQDRDPEKE